MEYKVTINWRKQVNLLIDDDTKLDTAIEQYLQQHMEALTKEGETEWTIQPLPMTLA